MSKELAKSEIETKFECKQVTLERFMEFMVKNFETEIRYYKKVAGWDDYWTSGDNVVRHRCDGSRKTSVLTVKMRKSADSITDRHEIDLPLEEHVPARDATAFLRLSGWKRSFTIHKESYIFVCELNEDVRLCIALYDVWPDGEERPKKYRRFLEIEVEKDSKLNIEDARFTLKLWTKRFQNGLDLDEPLNSSLYEMYAPK